MGNPACWEQATFLVINTPFRFFAVALSVPLNIVWAICHALIFPLLFILLILSIVWTILLAIILVYSYISKAVPFLRPVSFLLALPFLIVGDFIVTISPAVTPEDESAKMLKWELIEKFPYCTIFPVK